MRRPEQMLIEGFVAGLAYAAPIGPQNLYVIQSSARRSLPGALLVALVVTLMDVSLSQSCFFGLGWLTERSPAFSLALSVTGAVYLLVCGARMIASSGKVAQPTFDVSRHSLGRILGSAFVLTWANPAALIDGALLLGGFRASLPLAQVAPFALGIGLASAAWVFGVAIAVSALRRFLSLRALRWLQVGCGTLLACAGGKLAWTLTVSWLAGRGA